MKLYRVKDYSTDIEPIEVLRFNDKSVWIENNYNRKERREGRFTDYCHYYETIEQAKEYLVGIAERDLERAKSKLESAEKFLERAKAI